MLLRNYCYAMRMEARKSKARIKLKELKNLKKMRRIIQEADISRYRAALYRLSRLFLFDLRYC